MKTLLVSGSPRKNGNTDTVLAAIAAGAQSAGIETEIVYLRSYEIHPCVGCERCRKDKICTRFYDGMHLLYEKIDSSRGLVVGSPTYNYNITPWMKAFIDRFYPYFDFTNPRPGPYRSRLADQGRMAVAVGVCEQTEVSELGFTIPAMSDALRVIGYEIVAELPVTGHFAAGSVKKDTEVLSRAREAGRRLGENLLAQGA